MEKIFQKIETEAKAKGQVRWPTSVEGIAESDIINIVKKLVEEVEVLQLEVEKQIK